MVATAAKPLRYNGFGYAPTAVCRYAPKVEKMHRSVHTGKWALCDCIHLLKLVESVPTDLIQNHYKPLGEKPLYIKVGRLRGVFSFVSISGKCSDVSVRFGYKIILPYS